MEERRPHHLPIQYACGNRSMFPIISRSNSHSPMKPNGENSRSQYPFGSIFGAAFLKCSQLPTHVPLESRHVAGFGPFGGAAYRWLPFTCIWARQIGKQADPCFPLDCDNHSRRRPVVVTVALCLSVFANFLRSRVR